MSAGDGLAPRTALVGLAVGCGIAAAALVAVWVGAPGSDAAELVGISGGAAVGAGVAGWAIVRVLRPRSLRVQVFVVALVAVAATGLGVVAAAEAMFISSHDLGALGVVLLTAAGVAVGGAIACTNTVAGAAAHLHGVARRIGDAGGPAGSGAAAMPAGDLADLAAALEEAERRLAQAQARQAMLERDRRHLVTAMSHDLRAPIATLRAMTEALDDRVVDDAVTVERYHGVMRAEAERLTLLVDELFELSRLMSGTFELDASEDTVAALAAAAVEAAAAVGAARSVTVELAVDPVVADRRLPGREGRRVLGNLLDNAVRHSHGGGSVVVDVTPLGAEGGLRIAVSDSCGGIPEADLEHVFDTAFRGDTARLRDAGGGGLGLPITRGIVELLGGKVEVVNLDGGCCFTVALPSSSSRDLAGVSGG